MGDAAAVLAAKPELHLSKKEKGPGTSSASSLATWISVRRVRVAARASPAGLTTFAGKVRAGHFLFLEGPDRPICRLSQWY